jgi:hypothetical protein
MNRTLTPTYKMLLSLPIKLCFRRLNNILLMKYLKTVTFLVRPDPKGGAGRVTASSLKILETSTKILRSYNNSYILLVFIKYQIYLIDYF